MNVKDILTLIALTGLREAARSPEKVLAAAFIIDKFGVAGIRFVGRAGLVVIRSELALIYNIGKIGVQELAPALSRSTPLNAVRIAPAASTALLATAALGLASAPTLSYDTFSNTENYTQYPDGSLVTPSAFLEARFQR
jgi:hypothetical protein